MCQYASFCQCDRDKCFYGDPCACSRQYQTCDAGKTLNEEGVCVSCPEGTHKPEPGCGPCLHIDKNAKLDQRKMLIFPDAVPDTFTEPFKQPTTVKNEDDSTERVFESQTQDEQIGDESVTETDSTPSGLLIGIVCTLSVLVVVGLSFIVYLVRCRPHLSPDIVQPEQGPLIENPRQDQHRNNMRNIPETGDLLSKNGSNNNQEKFSDGNVDKVQGKNSSTLKCLMGTGNTQLEEMGDKSEKPSTLQEIIKEVVDEAEENAHGKDVGINFKKCNIESDKLSESKLLSDPNVYHNLQSDIDRMQVTKLNVASLKDSFVPGHTQVTEELQSPVMQTTDKGNIYYYQDPPSSGYDTGDSIPPISPMSVEAEKGIIQEYSSLVSASERNTESIISRLEVHNFVMKGEHNPSLDT